MCIIYRQPCKCTAMLGICALRMSTLKEFSLRKLARIPHTFIQHPLRVMRWRATSVKIASSTLAAAMLPDGTFISCQPGNLAFIRMGTALCPADRVDSIHVIPTVLRRFNGLLFLLSHHPGDFAFLSSPVPSHLPPPFPQCPFTHILVSPWH